LEKKRRIYHERRNNERAGGEGEGLLKAERKKKVSFFITTDRKEKGEIQCAVDSSQPTEKGRIVLNAASTKEKKNKTLQGKKGNCASRPRHARSGKKDSLSERTALQNSARKGGNKDTPIGSRREKEGLIHAPAGEGMYSLRSWKRK